MNLIPFPVIHPQATGQNILRLRQERGLSVRDIQTFFGFEEPRVIYMWQRGQCLPSVDNLFALSALLGVPMNEILVPSGPQPHIATCEQQATACCSIFCSLPPAALDAVAPKMASTLFAVPARTLAAGPMGADTGCAIRGGSKHGIRMGCRLPGIRADRRMAM